MKKIIQHTFAIALLIVVAGAMSVPAQAQNGQYASPALNQFLHVDCGTHDGHLIEKQIIQEGQANKPDLEDALVNGPSVADIAEVEAHAAKRYDARQQMIQNNRPKWMTEDHVRKINTISREDHIRMARESYISNFKAQAALGLRLIAQAPEQNGNPGGLNTALLGDGNVMLASYPNPAQGWSRVGFQVPQDGQVNLSIIDMSGKEVKVIFNQAVQGGLTYNLDVDLGDMTNGVYVYKLVTAEGTFTERLVVVK